jgi:protein-S-isoprenylcysteine O-methyltransferase Ste14
VTTSEPGLQTDAASTSAYSPILRRLGDFLFRCRSYTPVPLALLLVWQARITYPQFLCGLALMAGGELIRLAAVRSAGKSTRTRRVGARQLVTWGPYAHIRNPLYLGNLLIWIGAVLFAGGRFMPWLLGTVFVLFLVQYALIIALEEATLAELFGEAYTAYRQSVPRVIPRLRRVRGDSDAETETQAGVRRSWRYAFQSERSTLIALAAILALTLLSTSLKA